MWVWHSALVLSSTTIDELIDNFVLHNAVMRKLSNSKINRKKLNENSSIKETKTHRRTLKVKCLGAERQAKEMRISCESNQRSNPRGYAASGALMPSISVSIYKLPKRYEM